MNATLEPIRVTVDDGGEGTAPVVDALHIPSENWNGFAVPYLTREQAEAFLGRGEDLRWSFEADGTLVLVDYPDTEDECVTRIPQVDNLYRFDIGWTFMAAEDEV